MDQYQGKTLLLRGFHLGHRLRYNSSGVLTKNVPYGDWTADGFVTIDAVHVSGSRIVMAGRRLLVIVRDREFHFRPAEEKGWTEYHHESVTVSIEIDMGTHNPSFADVGADLSRIFLTSRDQLADLVPEYWKSCVSNGLEGKNSDCRFSPEVSAVPGIASVENTSTAGSSNSGTPIMPTAAGASATDSPHQGPFRVEAGVKPPKVLSFTEPVVSEYARAIKYQGVVTLGLLVDKEGRPRNIHILSPLGSGLDLEAVQAVANWKFQPAEKDGQPVPVEIAVEVSFPGY